MTQSLQDFIILLSHFFRGRIVAPLHSHKNTKPRNSHAVGVFEHDFLMGIGKASSIKEAGRLAAREALEMMSQK